MGPESRVTEPPTLDQHLGHQERVEHLAVPALVRELAVQALNVPVLTVPPQPIWSLPMICSAVGRALGMRCFPFGESPRVSPRGWTRLKGAGQHAPAT